MDSKVFGFLLSKDTQLDIPNKRILHYRAETPESSMCLKIVTLNDTQLQLLVLLLMNKPGDVISKDDIMASVFDKDGKEVFSSSQKLWYLIKSLRKKLSSIGIEDSFISSAYGTGYFINADNISPIFI